MSAERPAERVLAALEEDGLIRSQDQESNAPGRPASTWSIATDAGFVIGIIILILIPYSVHPSTRAASSSSFGRLTMYCLKKKIVPAAHRPGRNTPALESTRPILVIS